MSENEESNSQVKESRQQRRKRERSEPQIDKDRQNAAGFYEGMPGVWCDKDGNRRIFEIALTQDADVECRLGAHPVQIRACLLSVMHGNAMTRQTILTAASAFKKEHRKKLGAEKRKKIGFAVLKFISFGLIKGTVKDPFKPEPPKEQTSKLSDEDYQERVSDLESEDDSFDDDSMTIVE